MNGYPDKRSLTLDAGSFAVVYGLFAVRIKSAWYLGEACEHLLQPHVPGWISDSDIVPALVIGVILGPIAAKFLDPERWGSAAPGQEPTITLGVTRVMIGIQLWARFPLLFLISITSFIVVAIVLHPGVAVADIYLQGDYGIPVASEIFAMASQRDCRLSHSCHDSHVAVYFNVYPCDNTQSAASSYSRHRGLCHVHGSGSVTGDS